MTWQERALCADYPVPDLWYPNTNDPHSPKWDAPRAICDTCPVRLACLADALEQGDDQGMRGGLTPHELARIAGPRSRPIDHGTERGYRAHLRRGQPPCQWCTDAREEHRRKDQA
jgi:WhiB family redox-sensing transcriptional regulator